MKVHILLFDVTEENSSFSAQLDQMTKNCIDCLNVTQNYTSCTMLLHIKKRGFPHVSISQFSFPINISFRENESDVRRASEVYLK